MEFPNINKNTIFGLIILLIVSQYTISYSITEHRILYDHYEDDDQCVQKTCYRGTHEHNCDCRSNEFMCADFNSSTLDCLRCRNPDYYEIVKDEE